jgi:hypothetical protein
MIDFKNKTVFKLSPVDVKKVNKHIPSFLIEGEEIIAVFKSMRDQLVFTNKRVIACNVQGMTGKKTDYTSIPFSKVQTFSIETSGMLDLDCELEFYISSIGKIRFEIKGNFDIVGFNRIISSYVL